VAEVELTHPYIVTPSLVGQLMVVLPQTSQSPAVSEILVTLVAVASAKLTAEADAITLETNSPTLPAATLSLVVVPTMPPVVGLKVILEVVNAGSVVLHEGTPPELVTSIELLAVANAAMTFALEA